MGICTGGVEYTRVDMVDHRAQWTACTREGTKEGSKGCLFRLDLPFSLKSIVFSFQIEELLGARRCEGGDDLLYHHSGKPTDWVTVRMLHSKGDEISQRKAYK